MSLRLWTSTAGFWTFHTKCFQKKKKIFPFTNVIFPPHGHHRPVSLNQRLILRGARSLTKAVNSVTALCWIDFCCIEWTESFVLLLVRVFLQSNKLEKKNKSDISNMHMMISCQQHKLLIYSSGVSLNVPEQELYLLLHCFSSACE